MLARVISSQRSFSLNDRPEVRETFSAFEMVIESPASPAPIGHNGGPSIEEPAVVTGGPRAKVNGAGLGVLIVGPALALAAKFGWLPEAVATDPGSVIQLTALLLVAAAYAGAWFAPRNANAKA